MGFRRVLLIDISSSALEFMVSRGRGSKGRQGESSTSISQRGREEKEMGFNNTFGIDWLFTYTSRKREFLSGLAGSGSIFLLCFSTCMHL